MYSGDRSGEIMNIQIFGRKDFDTKKAERFFKERNIKFQSINLNEKEISKGELKSVLDSVDSVDNLLDPKSKDKDSLALINYSPESTKFEKILENQSVLKVPIVRNGKKATVGVDEKTWKKWIEEA